MVRMTFAWHILFAVLLVVASRVAAEDWPRFRGVNGSGVSTSTGLPDEFGPEKNVAWSVEVKAGTSSPVIVGGKLFITSLDGEDRIVQCLDAKTGQELWRQSAKKVRDENLSPPNGPATCTPAADEQNVVVFFQDTALLCYATTGELRCARKLVRSTACTESPIRRSLSETKCCCWPIRSKARISPGTT